ncbi:hypothetical protein HUK80_16275 [Flavobacterium sp. MAH-1]|uniref:Uncharacterized protein n=1 Tax=Flavobacterium agri TaxID=2743471 RepID=A0A7Y8Y4Y3_9FLAO|nr:hypothetical protein [Flavobacterium agri]NUY82463.1 hypothetical protein [Flavobacterium agri]NYA72487.1 hypothetical protein [Flavobacterium agri]
MKKTLLALSLIFLLEACQPTMNIINGSNKTLIFKDKQEYFEKNFSNSGIDSSKVVFLGEVKYNELAFEIQRNKLSTYYGIFENGANFISSAQMHIPSCQGQIVTLFNKIGNDDVDVEKIATVNEKIHTELKLDADKKTIVFIYSYKLGRLQDSKIESVIANLKQNKTFDYRLISLDNYDITHLDLN